MHLNSVQPAKLIDFAEVKSRTGDLSKATYWRLRKNKQFPQPVSVSPGRKAWLESEIAAWIAAKAADRVA